LLFNSQIFPEEVLQGQALGDFMIVKYGLFDEHLTPENIVLSNRSRDDSENGPMI